MRSVGAKTFYFRRGRWIDADVSAEEEKKAQQIERFSGAYFELARRLGKLAGPYLAFDEPVVVKIAGEVYQW